MVVLGMVLRTLVIIAIVGYFPLLAIRYRQERQTQRVYLLGMIFILFGVLNGSVVSYGRPFKGSAAFYLVGMVLIWCQTLHNFRSDRRESERNA